MLKHYPYLPWLLDCDIRMVCLKGVKVFFRILLRVSSGSLMDPTPLKNIPVNISIMPVNVSFEIRKSWDILKLDVMVISYKVTIILVHILVFCHVCTQTIGMFIWY